MQNAVSQAPQAVLQFRDPLDDLRRGGLRFDVGIERDFALDFLDRFGNRGFAVVYGMDDLRNDARKRIWVGHERIILQGSTEPEYSWPAILRQSFPRLVLGLVRWNMPYFRRQRAGRRFGHWFRHVRACKSRHHLVRH